MIGSNSLYLNPNKHGQIVAVTPDCTGEDVSAGVSHQRWRSRTGLNDIPALNNSMRIRSTDRRGLDGLRNQKL